jgi:predicted O-methyltransferase YrrM
MTVIKVITNSRGNPAFPYYGLVRQEAPPIGEVLREILEVRATLHGAGAMSAEALSAIVAHAGARAIRDSAETGCGASTLLLSHLSQRHTVFALDIGGSVSSVRRSALLRPEAVTFVEGSSQRTLPDHRFTGKLQLALIDGPHAYPFPDLEYYYLYPQLEPGALLILDDIQIRGIHNLFDFLRADAMFRLEDVVRSTAFFIRTDEPAFDPTGDNWQAQGYNARVLGRYEWKARLKRALPGAAARSIESLRHRAASGCSVEIDAPRAGEIVSDRGAVAGAARLTDDGHLWVLVHRKDVSGWWPQGGGEIAVAAGQWGVAVKYGDPPDAGREFEIAAVVVRRAIHEQWTEWVRSAHASGAYPPVQLPGFEAVLSQDFRTVTKRTV